MAYRAFWLDTKTGQAVELGRGVAPEVHIQYVLEHPETFGFTGSDAEKLRSMASGPVPYELTDYPDWLVRPLLRRWVKVRIDERYVNFTTQDRPSRQQLEAMQDWFMAKRFRLGVFLMGEPSGKILARFHKPEDFLAVRQPGELRRVAAQFRVGQVWRRRDGLCYRLVAQAQGGWSVRVGQQQGVWRFTDRHLHNLVCAERLRLTRVTARAVAGRLLVAGLPRLAERVLALLPDTVPDAQDEERALKEKLEDAPEQYRDALKNTLEKTQDILREEGPRTKPANRVANPRYVGRDSVREPNRITR